MIKNLVFKGGGIKGIAYVGALSVLQNYDLLKNIEAVAGTSAGAICATLFALKYSPDEIKSILGSIDFKKIEGGTNYFDLLTKSGIHDGLPFIKWMEDKIYKKTRIANSTFKDLKTNDFIDLKIISTDLSLSSVQVFDYDNTPDVIVSEAVRASISIPFFFEKWSFSKKVPNDHIYVDGGLLWNYPLTIFDKNGINHETLGFYLYDLEGLNKLQETKTLIQYIGALVNTFSWQLTRYIDNDPISLKRTVKINSLNYSSIQFNLTQSDIDLLIASGEKSMKEFYLNNKELFD